MCFIFMLDHITRLKQKKNTNSILISPTPNTIYYIYSNY